MRRPRSKGPGYWLRRAAPAYVTGWGCAAVSVLCAGVSGEWFWLVMAAVTGATGWWIWHTRQVWNDNAERWRLNRDGAF